MPLSPGARLGDYEIRQPLGAGGMGEVYLARDRKLGRSVAIKVLSGELRSHPDRIRRFEQEARAASALSHPNVCVVHALGETAEGQPFIAMEYVEGQTLRQLLQTEPPALKVALDIAIQVAAGTGAAHAIGIVHRDLKPENVIVRPDGLVKVLDFGLAKLAEDQQAAGASEATRTLVKTDTGVVMGTFTYMSPEQARGREADARTDIWALGVMLYELVSGRVPFAGETRSDVIVSILEREPAPLDTLNPAVPHELQRIVAKALRKDRAQRYQTIADLRLDMEALKTELQVSSDAAPVVTPAAPTPQPVRRESSAEYILTGLARHKLAALTGLLAICIVAGAALWRVLRSPADRTPPPTPRVERTLTRLTFGEGLQTDPALSPDGRYLAYASDRAGNFDIWVQPLAGGDPVQVTREPDADTQPAWSPDGASIVFRSERGGGGLFVVPQFGGPSRRLTSYGEHPSWSGNGSEVFFTVWSAQASETRARLFAVPGDGGTPTELAAPVLSHGYWQWIAQHPDGRFSALGTHETEGTGFFTFGRAGDHMVKSDTSAVPELVSETGFDRGRFVWNRTGTRLYVEAKVKVQNIWRVDVDPATLAWRRADRLTVGGGSDVNAVLSSDGGRLVYVQQSTSRRFWSFPFDPVARRIGEGQAVSDASLEAFLGDLSPDGSAAAFMLLRPGAESGDIWIHRFDTDTTQLVVPNGFWPKWAPGGRSLLYVRQTAQGAALMEWSPDGTERPVSSWSHARTLLPGSAVPGTRSVLVTVYGDGAANPLWLWDLDSSRDAPQRVIVDRPRTSIWEPNLSPNGRWLAFSGVGEGVILARFGDGPITEWPAVVPALEGTDKPRWAPDGRTLYFLANRGGYLNLGGIRFDPDRGSVIGEPFELTHFNSPGLVVTPRIDRTEIGVAANRVMLSMDATSGSIWMLEHVDK